MKQLTVEGVRRIRTKQEQRELCETSDLVVDIEGRMLEWLGNMIRMAQTRVD
jgi:hypothetical protein